MTAVSDFHREYALTMSEKALSQLIVDMAQSLGWRCHRTWNSLHSPAGWPDLILVKEGTMLCIELKTMTGKISQAQAEWLYELGTVRHVEIGEWRPNMWLDGRIEARLRGEDGQDD